MNPLRSAPGEDPVVLSAVFSAPVSRVYQAWTDPNDIIGWFGSPADRAESAEMDLRPGGLWRIRFEADAEQPGWLEGKYVEIEPEKRLVFTWTHILPGEDGKEISSPTSQVTIGFEPEGTGTRLSLRHESISTESARRNVVTGWVATFERLESSLRAS